MQNMKALRASPSFKGSYLYIKSCIASPYSSKDKISLSFNG